MSWTIYRWNYTHWWQIPMLAVHIIYTLVRATYIPVNTMCPSWTIHRCINDLTCSIKKTCNDYQLYLATSVFPIQTWKKSSVTALIDSDRDTIPDNASTVSTIGCYLRAAHGACSCDLYISNNCKDEENGSPYNRKTNGLYNRSSQLTIGKKVRSLICAAA